MKWTILLMTTRVITNVGTLGIAGETTGTMIGMETTGITGGTTGGEAGAEAGAGTSVAGEEGAVTLTGETEIGMTVGEGTEIMTEGTEGIEIEKTDIETGMTVSVTGTGIEKIEGIGVIETMMTGAAVERRPLPGAVPWKK